ncbi:MAG: helix-turn-helix domain-containing protein [Clostridia bacterium]|nr:helix-turn-helix domain-containing protein [Clostridia bacterium]
MKITEIQRQQIIATYIAGKGEISQTVLAKKYGVSRSTISKILNSAEINKSIIEKKEQSVLSMLEYIESKQGEAQGLMSQILDKAGVKLKADNSLRDLMGALKILADVFSKSAENKDEANDSKQVVFKIVGVKDNVDATD